MQLANLVLNFYLGNGPIHRSEQVSISCAAERKNKIKSENSGSCLRHMLVKLFSGNLTFREIRGNTLK